MEPASTVVEIINAWRIFWVQCGDDRGNRGARDRRRWEAGMQIGIVNRFTISVGWHHARPPVAPHCITGLYVLKRRVYLEVHVEEQPIPNNTGYKAHVVGPPCFALDERGDSERLRERHDCSGRRPITRENLPCKSIVHECLCGGLGRSRAHEICAGRE